MTVAAVGSLGVGVEADIAVFKLEDVNVQLEDPLGQLRHVTTRLRCVLSCDNLLLGKSPCVILLVQTKTIHERRDAIVC